MSKISKILTIVFSSLAVVFIGLWFALPPITQWYLNRALSHVEGYEGRVGSVGLHHIFRGAAVINDIRIQMKNGKVLLPFMEVKKVDGSLQWSQLFRGHGKRPTSIFSRPL